MVFPACPNCTGPQIVPLTPLQNLAASTRAQNPSSTRRRFAIAIVDLSIYATLPDRKAMASIAIKPDINSNEIIAAIRFALGLSFHDLRP